MIKVFDDIVDIRTRNNLKNELLNENKLQYG